jgi:hypothetical protein
MACNGPEDVDVDPRLERAFRRGYISGMYDALIGIRSRLSDEEFTELEEWVSRNLTTWSTTDLEKPLRPPTPAASSFLPAA